MVEATTEHDEVVPAPPGASRRAVLVGAGATAIAILGGCATYDQTGGGARNGDGAGADSGEDPEGDPGEGGGADPGAPPAPLAQTGDIPVGGGKVFDQRKVVVTQPVAGTFVAFSAICTHQGCVVAEVRDGTINCPCHGSKFKVADGSVARGPASQGLRSRGITVDGTNITLA